MAKGCHISVLSNVPNIFKSSSPFPLLENAENCLCLEMLKKTYVSYLNKEISIHDFEYVVTTDILFLLQEIVS